MSASPSPDDESSTSRQRVTRACDLCRRKKVKCDGALPVCTNCKALNLECTFNDKTKKRGPPKGYIEAVENRLYRLENFLADLAKGGDIPAEELLKELNAPLAAPTGEQISTRPVRRAPRSEREKVFYWQQDQAGKRKREALKEKHREHSSRGESNMLHISTETDTAALNACLQNDADDNGEDRSKRRKINESTAIVGQLSMDESGHVRYLGKSSNYYLLQNSKAYQNGAFHFANYGKSSRLRQNAQHAKPTTTNPRELPPDDLAEHLRNLYFQHFYPFLPIFYKRQFQTSTKDRTTPPLLLNAVYAVASRISPDIRARTDPFSPDTAGDVFFQRAERLLDESYDTPSISTVQALLLLSTHQHGVMRSARAWLYSGMAFRMAQDLGLHRNCDTWNISPEERETRKRLFWCCYIVDRLTSAMYGRAFTFEERDCDAPLPSMDDDEPIATIKQSEVQQDGHSHNDVRLLDIFKNLIKMADMLGHVLKNVYYVRSLQNVNDRHIESVLSTWNKKLHQWYDRLPDSLQLQHQTTTHSDTAILISPVAVCQLHMMYYTTMILLHRPFIPNAEQSLIPTTTMLPCSSVCSAAADSIINIINDLFSAQQLRFLMNFSVYYVFTAAIVIIQQNASNDESAGQQQRHHTQKEMVSQWKLKRCMLALSEIEPTWPTASKTCQILAELSGLPTTNEHQEKSDAQECQQTAYQPGFGPHPYRATKNSSAFNSFDSLSAHSSPQPYPAQITLPTTDNMSNLGFSAMRSEAALADLRHRPLLNSQIKSHYHHQHHQQQGQQPQTGQQPQPQPQPQQQPQQQALAPPPTTHIGMDFVIPDPFQVPTSNTDHTMDPFAAPGIIPIPSHRPDQSPMTPFDPLETALWGMPTNNALTAATSTARRATLNSNDWNHFMAANMQRPWQQQQSPFSNTTSSTAISTPALVDMTTHTTSTNQQSVHQNYTHSKTDSTMYY